MKWNEEKRRDWMEERLYRYRQKCIRERENARMKFAWVRAPDSPRASPLCSRENIRLALYARLREAAEGVEAYNIETAREVSAICDSAMRYVMSVIVLPITHGAPRVVRDSRHVRNPEGNFRMLLRKKIPRSRPIIKSVWFDAMVIQLREARRLQRHDATLALFSYVT